MKDGVEDNMAGNPDLKAYFGNEKVPHSPASIVESQTSSTIKKRPRTPIETVIFSTIVALPPTVGMILSWLPFTQISLHGAPHDLILNAWLSVFELSGVLALLGILLAFCHSPRFRGWAVNDVTKSWYSKFSSFMHVWISVVPLLTAFWSWFCTCWNDCADLGDARCQVDNVPLLLGMFYRMGGGPTLMGIGIAVFMSVEEREDKRREARDKAASAT